ncbi:Thiol:disulfide interchange protein DsbA precursor [Phocoenobacter uteri]|uniref:Thiol:disulfide interchange protein n=1 Tax=Phocoenobacter uteri TaxID=146806 RepID=A0A379CBT0_9PAST|nr:DsbA family protein [Phocoenobacter uteri]MDG6881795.1 thiol:disulfide interchange protein [Phocoenobacter uteri]SUB59832.1 Thiol:disulfide interchange protein DsbA precursor [Phocoenobacter uteri]
MKKLLLKSSLVALLGLASFNATAFEPTLGKDYIEVSQAPVAQKEVVEFFSFYCPHCYNFEMEYKIPSLIKEKLPKDVTMKQYHVSFLGKEGKDLTRAWSLAMAMGVEDKVKTPLFEAVQGHKINSMDDIRALFIENGISAEQFDGGINSFAVNGLVKKQEDLAESLNVQGVPAFFVDNKYQVNNEGFSDVKTNEEFIQRYIDIVLSLTEK